MDPSACAGVSTALPVEPFRDSPSSHCSPVVRSDGELKPDAGAPPLCAAVLFVVVRADARHFRANEEACPSFARYLREASAAGVRVLAHQVRWEEGKAFSVGSLPVQLGS